MTLWNKLFDDPEHPLSLAETPQGLPVLFLAFHELPAPEIERRAQAIADVEPLPEPVVGRHDPSFTENGQLFAAFRFGDHQIDVVGLNAALPPELMKEITSTSHWAPEYVEILKLHQAHLICYYHGLSPDPVEQYLALYKVANAFDDDCLGLVNEPAMTFHPSMFTAEVCTPEMLEACRGAAPLHLWTGFIKLFTDIGTWYITRGFHLFGLKDFAYFGTDEKPSDVHDLFARVFYYAVKGNVELAPGDTLQIGANRFLRFAEVSEYHEHIVGPKGSLVLESVAGNQVVH